MTGLQIGGVKWGLSNSYFYSVILHDVCEKLSFLQSQFVFKTRFHTRGRILGHDFVPQNFALFLTLSCRAPPFWEPKNVGSSSITSFGELFGGLMKMSEAEGDEKNTGETRQRNRRKQKSRT